MKVLDRFFLDSAALSERSCVNEERMNRFNSCRKKEFLNLFRRSAEYTRD